MEELAGQLAHRRLLTLGGPPGCGKTRLALEIAAATRDRFSDGVAFVDLGLIAEAKAVTDAAASAVGLPAQSVENLAHSIGDSTVLLLIDNAEHLIESVCCLAEQLLGSCPNLRIMTTSREPLNIDGELYWPVEPLQIPPSHLQDAEALGAYDAISLFCMRVSDHQPDFRLAASNAPQVATICRRLDGIPLALELAAAAVRSLGLTEVAASLTDSFRILTQGRRTAVARHRTIRAAIEWSHDLLDHNEKVLFRRLALFPATFDMKAVTAICADSNLPKAAVSETLSRLVAKSLVAPRPTPAGDLRYGLLEVVRHCCSDRLAASEDGDLAVRQAQYYAMLADELSIAGGDFQQRVSRIDAEYANLQAALDWATRHDALLAAALTEHLQWYWALRGTFREARHRLDSALTRAELDAPIAARLCVLAATASRRLGDGAAFRAYLDRASRLARSAADPSLSVWIASAQGLMATQECDWAGAETWFRRVIELIEDMPASFEDNVVRMHGWPPSRARTMVMTRNNLALTLVQVGRHTEALDQIEQALAAAAGVFERSISLSLLLDTRGQVYLALGRLTEARAGFVGALDEAAAYANDHQAVGPLFGLALSAATAGDYASALTFMAAARRAARSSHMEWTMALRHQVDLIISTERSSREALAESRANAAWERGSEMDITGALGFARSVEQSESRPILSVRETDVARRVARGLTDKEIARELSISPRTVEVHLAHIRRRLGLRNRAEIAVWAVSDGSAG